MPDARGEWVPGDGPVAEHVPTFIVAGFMRSGTSMMMRALYEGMERAVAMVVDESRKAKLNAGETTPNHEYLEPPMEDFETPEFPRKHEGKLLKCMMAGFHPLWPMRGGMHVVQMWRDPKLIHESWKAHPALPDPDEVAPWLTEDGGAGYWVRMKACSAMLRNRRDVLSHTDIFFPEVVSDPAIFFRTLQDRGWPITDVDAAAAVVNPDLVRVA